MTKIDESFGSLQKEIEAKFARMRSQNTDRKRTAWLPKEFWVKR
jgi:hypothetical protein